MIEILSAPGEVPERKRVNGVVVSLWTSEFMDPNKVRTTESPVSGIDFEIYTKVPPTDAQLEEFVRRIQIAHNVHKAL